MHRSIDRLTAKQWRDCRGFTLLEMILSVLLTGILATAAFSLTNGAIQMGAEVSEDQRRTLEIQRCLEIFRDNFESLPGSARLELLAEDTGTESLSELRLYDVPEAFRPGGILLRSDAVSIIAEETEDEESTELLLRYDTFGEGEDDVESRYLPLMGGLAEVGWRIFSPLDEDWLTEWEEAQGRPRLIELNLVFVEGRDPVRVAFWLPPVANPRDLVAGMIQENQAPVQEGEQAPQEGQQSQPPGKAAPVPGQPPGSPAPLPNRNSSPAQQ